MTVRHLRVLLAGILALIGLFAPLTGGMAAETPEALMLNGSIRLPLRYVVESLGGAISYDVRSAQVVASLADQTLMLKSNQRTATVNGTATELDVAPVEVNGVLYISQLTAVSALGVQVTVDTQSLVVRKGSRKVMLPFEGQLTTQTAEPVRNAPAAPTPSVPQQPRSAAPRAISAQGGIGPALASCCLSPVPAGQLMNSDYAVPDRSYARILIIPAIIDAVNAYNGETVAEYYGRQSMRDNGAQKDSGTAAFMSACCWAGVPIGQVMNSGQSEIPSRIILRSLPYVSYVASIYDGMQAYNGEGLPEYGIDAGLW